MTRQEYLAELNTHLASLSAEERENAVRFYEEYFEDAGVENEAAVMAELGKPYTLAKSIICEQSAYSKSHSYAKYRASCSMENGNSAPNDTEPDIMPNSEKPHTQYTSYEQADTASQNYDTFYESYKENYKSSASGNTYTSSSNTDNDTAILVVGLIFGVFFGIPLLLLFLAILIAVILGVVGCSITALIMIILCIVSIVSIGFGYAMTYLGLSMIMVGIAFICGAVMRVLIKGIPWAVKKIAGFFKKYSKEVI